MLDAGSTVYEFLDADFHGETAKAAKLAVALEEWNQRFDLPTSYRRCVLTSRDELLDLIDRYAA